MSEFKFPCPHCQRKLQIDEQFSGRELQCPNCHVLFRVPPVPGKTVDYKPESGKTWDTFLPAVKKSVGRIGVPPAVESVRPAARNGLQCIVAHQRFRRARTERGLFRRAGRIGL